MVALSYWLQKGVRSNNHEKLEVLEEYCWYLAREKGKVAIRYG